MSISHPSAAGHTSQRRPHRGRPFSARSRRRARRDRGQTTPLWAIVLVLAGLLLVPLGLVARATIERAQAQNAADATALAGALEGEQEARSVARANGARLVDYRRSEDSIRVIVVIGDRRATARAERETVVVPSGRPEPDRPG